MPDLTHDRPEQEDLSEQTEPAALARARGEEEADVILDVPCLKVEEVDLEVADLAAAVSLHADVLQLLKLHVGADVSLGRVHLNIKGVDAQLLLKVRLDRVALIIDRVLATIDRNPQILEQLVIGVGRAVGAIGEGAAGAVEEVGAGVGEGVADVGAGVGEGVADVGAGVADVGAGVGEGVADVAERATGAVGDVGAGARTAVPDGAALAAGAQRSQQSTVASAGDAHSTGHEQPAADDDDEKT